MTAIHFSVIVLAAICSQGATHYGHGQNYNGQWNNYGNRNGPWNNYGNRYSSWNYFNNQFLFSRGIALCFNRYTGTVQNGGIPIAPVDVFGQQVPQNLNPVISPAGDKLKRVCDCNCEQINWICGNDGLSYVNRCSLDCHATTNPQKAGLALQFWGLCGQNLIGRCFNRYTGDVPNGGIPISQVDVFNQPVPNVLNPTNAVGQSVKRICDCECQQINWICGTDGLSYVNRCALDCQATTVNNNLNVASWGFCPPNLFNQFNNWYKRK